MLLNHIQNQILYSDKLETDNTLHVIRVISNPAMYHSRYRLFREQSDFLRQCPNVVLYTVEATFGDRQPELIKEVRENYLRVRINTEIWIKENLINLAVEHLLPEDWKYVAWIDSDVTWADTNWAQKALNELQHYDVIQPWTDAIDLGPDGTIMNTFKSFCSQNIKQFALDFQNKVNNTKIKPPKGTPGTSLPDYSYARYSHTGYAWCATRYFWENVDGLPEFCILGSADHNAALSLINKVEYSIHSDMTESFKNECFRWQQKAFRITKGHVGATNSRLYHSFHGSKKKRYYTDRWKILTQYKFDPVRDLMKTENGIVHLVGKADLEEAIRQYNRSRDEDGISED